MNVVVLAGAVVLWGAVHSLLASLMAKRRAQRMLGESAGRAYRLGYNAFAVVTFLPVLGLMRLLPDRTIYAFAPPWLFGMLAGQALAAVCLLMALLQTDPLHFIGIRQLVQGSTSAVLVATGFYRLVRHPLYLFGLVFIWLTPVMTVNLLTVFVALTVYILVGAVLEEQRLLQEFGDAYVEYRARTPMIIPGLRLARWSRRGPGGRTQA